MKAIRVGITCTLTSATLLLGAGCGGAGATSAAGGARVKDAEGVRSELQNRDERTLAPEAMAVGDQELRYAKDADAKDDTVGAELYADRAVAAYRHATVLARLVRATSIDEGARRTLAEASEERQKFATERQKFDREAVDLEKRLRAAREAEFASSAQKTGKVDPARERARLVAAQSLATQARLLCGAARLLSADIPGLKEAEEGASTAFREASQPKGQSGKDLPIDSASRARAGCLTVLTKARRASPSSDEQADTLLGELSSTSGGSLGWEKEASPTTTTPPADRARALAPLRDERGVVVTLQSPFDGNGLSREGLPVVQELGKVAAAHPTFPVQIVLHGASADAERNAKRGDALTRALLQGGAKGTKVAVENAISGAPVTSADLSNRNRRAENERVEIVFVAPGAAP